MFGGLAKKAAAAILFAMNTDHRSFAASSLDGRASCLAHRLVAGALAVAIAATPYEPFAAASHACDAVRATVVADSVDEAREACDAAALAAAFLERQGVHQKRSIELHVVDRLPRTEETSTRAGVYLHSERRAYVLRRDRWPADATHFGLPMSAELYRSVVVHEAAHAIAADHFRPERPDVVAHEYLAYTAQIDSLPPALRDRALADASGDAPVALARFNVFVLGMNPDRFAALAWRHWSEPGNGTVFVQALLAGEVLNGG